MNDLQCQFPIVKGVAPRCTNKARWHDYYRWAFCDEHKTDGERLLGSERPTLRAVDKAGVCRVDRHVFIDGICAQCGTAIASLTTNA